MEIVFITSLFLFIYSYLIYPVILWAFLRVSRNPWTQSEIWPCVTIIISAFNEEAVIEEKIENALSLDYPKENFEVIVCSDGSTDRTNDIVRGINDPRLILHTYDRIGKTACLNKSVPAAKGEVILFTDANSIFPPDVLVKIVRNFCDAKVGLVTGWTKYRDPNGGKETTGSYSLFEKWQKYSESMISSCVGADGAIFAIRKSLYRTLRDEDINDFVIPLKVIGEGKRVVLDAQVFCYEEPSQSVEGSFRRQIRITTRTLRAIFNNLPFLNIFQFGSFSFFMISHKLIRLLAPFFLLSAIFINFFILFRSPTYMLTLIGYFVFFSIALSNLLGILNGKIASICKFLLITFSAQLIGGLRMFTGVQVTLWTPRR